MMVLFPVRPVAAGFYSRMRVLPVVLADLLAHGGHTVLRGDRLQALRRVRLVIDVILCAQGDMGVDGGGLRAGLDDAPRDCDRVAGFLLANRVAVWHDLGMAGVFFAHRLRVDRLAVPRAFVRRDDLPQALVGLVLRRWVFVDGHSDDDLVDPAALHRVARPAVAREAARVRGVARVVPVVAGVDIGRGKTRRLRRCVRIDEVDAPPAACVLARHGADAARGGAVRPVRTRARIHRAVLMYDGDGFYIVFQVGAQLEEIRIKAVFGHVDGHGDFGGGVVVLQHRAGIGARRAEPLPEIDRIRRERLVAHGQRMVIEIRRMRILAVPAVVGTVAVNIIRHGLVHIAVIRRGDALRVLGERRAHGGVEIELRRVGPGLVGIAADVFLARDIGKVVFAVLDARDRAGRAALRDIELGKAVAVQQRFKRAGYDGRRFARDRAVARRADRGADRAVAQADEYNRFRRLIRPDGQRPCVLALLGANFLGKRLGVVLAHRQEVRAVNFGLADIRQPGLPYEQLAGNEQVARFRGVKPLRRRGGRLIRSQARQAGRERPHRAVLMQGDGEGRVLVDRFRQRLGRGSRLLIFIRGLCARIRGRAAVRVVARDLDIVIVRPVDVAQHDPVKDRLLKELPAHDDVHRVEAAMPLGVLRARGLHARVERKAEALHTRHRVVRQAEGRQVLARVGHDVPVAVLVDGGGQRGAVVTRAAGVRRVGVVTCAIAKRRAVIVFRPGGGHRARLLDVEGGVLPLLAAVVRLDLLARAGNIVDKTRFRQDIVAKVVVFLQVRPAIAVIAGHIYLFARRMRVESRQVVLGVHKVLRARKGLLVSILVAVAPREAQHAHFAAVVRAALRLDVAVKAGEHDFDAAGVGDACLAVRVRFVIPRGIVHLGALPAAAACQQAFQLVAQDGAAARNRLALRVQHGRKAVVHADFCNRGHAFVQHRHPARCGVAAGHRARVFIIGRRRPGGRRFRVRLCRLAIEAGHAVRRLPAQQGLAVADQLAVEEQAGCLEAAAAVLLLVGVRVVAVQRQVDAEHRAGHSARRLVAEAHTVEQAVFVLIRQGEGVPVVVRIPACLKRQRVGRAGIRGVVRLGGGHIDRRVGRADVQARPAIDRAGIGRHRGGSADGLVALRPAARQLEELAHGDILAGVDLVAVFVDIVVRIAVRRAVKV